MIKNQFKVVFKVNCLLHYQIGHNYKEDELKTYFKFFIKKTLYTSLVVTSKKKSIFKDIIQIKVDHPPSYPIFDKLFFDKF